MKSIYNTLEFDKILEKVSNHASLADSKAIIKNLKIINDKNLLFKKLNEVDSALSYLKGGYFINIAKIDNVSESILRLQKSAALSLSELLNISKLLDNAINLIKINKSRDIPTNLDSYFNDLNPLTSENSQIKNILTSENEIADNASKALQSIRRRKKILIDKLNITSTKILNIYSDYLQEPILTNKDNSICLPVKSEFKNKIDGTVHSISGSQFTVFIEPKEIIQIKNEIAENDALEEIEIAKILYDLSKALSPYTDIIQNNYNLIIDLDVIFAKAKYAYSESSSKPIISENQNINLIDARHPLINKNDIVPLNIYLGQNFSSLIITGPNTGGKTVSLKTVGIIELMALSGLFIPAKENSEVGFFDNIFADIGDEQSIEQSLSTFSSHMNNIVYILNNSTCNSLVLLDEICTGTDPIEGASLAIAILEFLRMHETRVIATTHYPELKQYAITNSHVENGAFEFDVETLKPTYKLLIGIPGKSNAFAISKKLGLSDDIIERAKNSLDTKDVKFEDLVASLEENKKIIEEEKRKIENYKLEIEELKNKVKRQEKGLNDRSSAIIRQAKEKANTILYDAKKLADETIKNIKSNTNDISHAMSERTKLSRALKDSADSLVERIKGPSQPISPKKIKLGSNVKVLSLNSNGVVETLPDKDYNLFVRIGIIRSQVNLRDLELLEENNIKIDNVNIKRTYTKSGSSKIKYEKSHFVSPEINLIGLTVDEAIAKLDKYVDDAYITHLSSIRIIHGRGTGALKHAISEYCRKSSLILDYKLGNFDEGGDGVTIATLKDQ